MPSRTRAPRSPRSLVALALLAAMVAVSTAGATLAHQGPTSPTLTTAGSGAVEPAVSRSSEADPRRADPGRDYDRGPSLRGVAPSPRSAIGTAAAAATVAAATPERADWISRAETDTPAPRPRTVSTDEGDGSADAATFSGRNRVWIPALGIRRSVSSFACSSNAYPGDRVYRWGCAGRNNVYLFGHAHSVFKPLHDAYVRGRLSKGMKVYFANNAGTVSTYKVVWWKVTTPDKGAFAYAAQSRPSMTLQTCVGAKSQYRLIVRLVKTG